MKQKQFIRFVVNDNGNGKIKAMNKIVKVYDDEDKFLKIEPPYIYATGTQINVDMKESDTGKFKPLRHFKHKNGKIKKKTTAEITQSDNDYQQAKETRRQEIEQKNQEIESAKNIIANEGKTDKERLKAVSDLIGLKEI